MPHKPIIHGSDHWPDGNDPSGTHWYFVLPIEPASAEGFEVENTFSALFEDPWGNIEDYEATAFRIAENGRPAIRVIATGGEEELGSVIFTLPVNFRPLRVQRRFAVLGTGVGIIEARVNGDIVFIGPLTP